MRSSVFPLFFKKISKQTSPTFIISLIIFNFFGIVFISNALISKTQFEEGLSHETLIDIDGDIMPPGFDQLEIENILYNFENINISKDLDLDFGLVIGIQIDDDNDSLIIPFIGLSEELLHKLNITNSHSVISDIGTTQINITNVENTSNHLMIELSSNENLIKNELYMNILRKSQFHSLGLSSQIIDYWKFSIIGNLSYCLNIISELEISNAKVGGFFYGYVNNELYSQTTIKQLDNLVEEFEIKLFQKLIIIGINPYSIVIESKLRTAINNIEANIGEEIMSTQFLSIPSIILILLLIFSLELGITSYFRKLRSILNSRGLSKKRTKILFFTIELVSDLFACLLTILFYSIMVFVLKIHHPLIFILLKSLGTTLLILVLCKSLNFFLLKDKELFKNKQVNKHTRKKKETNKLKIISLVLLLLIISLQIVRHIEPLFWFPIISGIKGILFDIISLIIIFVNLVILYLPNSYTTRKTNQENIDSLIKGFFNKTVKKVKVHRMAIFGFFTIMTFLLVNLTTTKLYSTSENNEYLFDFSILIKSSEELGIESNEIFNLTRNFPELKNLTLLNTFPSSILSKRSLDSVQIFAFNSTIYSSKNLGRDRFLCNTKLTNNDIFSRMNKTTIILNKKLAEKIGARIGSNISLEANHFASVNGSFVSISRNNLKVIGILDSFHIPNIWSFITPFAYIDYTLFEDLRGSKGLPVLPMEFSFDLQYEETNSTIIENLQIQTIEKIKETLNLHTGSITITDYGLQSTHYSELHYTSQLCFIWIELIIIIILLPFTTLALNSKMMKSLKPFLRIIESRGYSNKMMRRIYTKEMFSTLTSSLMLGITVGLITSNIYLYYQIPTLFFTYHLNIFYSIIAIIFVLLLGGISSIAIIQIISNRNIKTLRTNGDQQIWLT